MDGVCEDDLCWLQLDDFRMLLIKNIEPSRITPYLRQCQVHLLHLPYTSPPAAHPFLIHHLFLHKSLPTSASARYSAAATPPSAPSIPGTPPASPYTFVLAYSAPPSSTHNTCYLHQNQELLLSLLLPLLLPHLALCCVPNVAVAPPAASYHAVPPPPPPLLYISAADWLFCGGCCQVISAEDEEQLFNDPALVIRRRKVGKKHIVCVETESLFLKHLKSPGGSVRPEPM